MTKFFTLAFLLCLSFISYADVIYVDADATGADNGNNWTNAYNFISSAVSNSNPEDEIWVAEGTYLRAASSGWDIEHTLRIYGGFEGNETNKGQRNPNVYPVTISGEDGAPNDEADNERMSFGFAADPNSIVVIDGFIFEDFYSDNTASIISVSFNLANEDIEIKIKNCIFKNNFNTAFYCSQGNAIIENCAFYNNTPMDPNGYLVGFAYRDSFKVVNCTFTDNDVYGVVRCWSENSHLEIYNSIFWNNTVNDYEVTASYQNFWYANSLMISNSIIETPDPREDPNYIFENILSVDPGFVNASNQDYRLLPCSPAIDIGLDDVLALNKDLLFNQRNSGSKIDLGAIEYQQAENIHYVDIDAPGIENGTSWPNAYTDLQDALSAAEFGDQIWVAEGTYLPTDIADPVAKFILPCGIKLYGGFMGTESLLSQRDIESNETILSGSIPGLVPTYHILKSDEENSTTEIDGFSIIGSNASPGATSRGGGFWGINFSGRIVNCTFQQNLANKGGAIYLVDSDLPQIVNCSFISNQATISGGGIFGKNSNFELKRSHFYTNIASAVHIESGDLDLENCLFNSNLNGNDGAALLMDDSATATIKWATFVFNLTNNVSSGAVHHLGTDGQVKVNVINSIFWNNLDGVFDDISLGGQASNYNARNSIIENGFASGINIFEDDPLFANEIGADYNLSNCSPALNAAIEIEETPLLDINNRFRTIGEKPDLGAYEYRFPFSLDGYGGLDTMVVCGDDTQELNFSLQKKDTTFTEWDGTNSYNGIMFEVRPKVPMLVNDLLVHHDCGLNPKHRVYFKEGSWSGSEVSPDDWTNLMAGFGNVSSCGIGDTAAMIGQLGSPVVLVPEKKYSFYISVLSVTQPVSNLLRTHNDPAAGFGNEYLETDHFTIYHGRGVSDELFGSPSAFSQIFEGGLIYQLYDSIEWKSGGLVISNDRSVIVSPTTDSVFRVKMYSVNGCVYTDKVQLLQSDLPANDLCVDAIQLFPDQLKTAGTTKCASSSNLSSTSCNANEGNSVWYKFRAPGSGRMNINIKDLEAVNGAFFNVQVNVYEGPCFSLSYMDCANDSSTLEEEILMLTGLTEGQMYFVMVDSKNDQEGNFNIKIKDPCINDFEEPQDLPMDTMVCLEGAFDLTTGMKSLDTVIVPSIHGDTSNVIFFDVEAKADLRIDDVYCHLTAAINFNVAVYYRIGGHFGYELSPSAWTYAGEQLVSPTGSNGQVVAVGEDLNIILKEGERVGFYILPTTPIPIKVIHRNVAAPHLTEAMSSDFLTLYKGYAGIGTTAFLHSIKPDPIALEGEVHATLLDEIKWYQNGIEFSNDVDVSINLEESSEIVYELDHANGCILKDTVQIDVEKLIVKNNLDEGLNSLRSVLGCLTANDTATFDPVLFGDTIRLTSAQISLDVDNSVIKGLGATGITISGESDKRIFKNAADSHLTIMDVGLINGKSTNVDGGGAIKNDGTLFLKNCIVANNQTTLNGGAIWNNWRLSLEQVLLKNNQALGEGEHIYNAPDSDRILINGLVNIRN